MATLADQISAYKDAKSLIATDNANIQATQKALDDLNSSLGKDQSGLSAATANLGASLKATGGTYEGPNSDGTIDLYLPDGSGGVLFEVISPATIPVPAPAPAPVVTEHRNIGS